MASCFTISPVLSVQTPFGQLQQQHQQHQQHLLPSCAVDYQPPFKRQRVENNSHFCSSSSSSSYHDPLSASWAYPQPNPSPLLPWEEEEEEEGQHASWGGEDVGFDLESELNLLMHDLHSSSEERATSPGLPFSYHDESTWTWSPPPLSSPSSSTFSPSSSSFVPSPVSGYWLAPSPLCSSPSSDMSPPLSPVVSDHQESAEQCASSTNTHQQPSTSSMQLYLTHKPRGSGGRYVPLAPDQHIRVTKGKGKRLRLGVKSDRQFEWNQLQLNLIDVTTGSNCNDHFTIWNHKSSIEDDHDTGGTLAEVEVTVNKLSPQLQFEVIIDTSTTGGSCATLGDSWTWQGRSPSFGTHNNGKDRSVRALRKQRKDALRAAARAAASSRSLRNKANRST